MDGCSKKEMTDDTSIFTVKLQVLRMAFDLVKELGRASSCMWYLLTPPNFRLVILKKKKKGNRLYIAGMLEISNNLG